MLIDTLVYIVLDGKLTKQKWFESTAGLFLTDSFDAECSAYWGIFYFPTVNIKYIIPFVTNYIELGWKFFWQKHGYKMQAMFRIHCPIHYCMLLPANFISLTDSIGHESKFKMIENLVWYWKRHLICKTMFVAWNGRE